jgi:hypothetical protein
MDIVKGKDIPENGEKMIDNICPELWPFLAVVRTDIVPRLYDVFAEEAD